MDLLSVRTQFDGLVIVEELKVLGMEGHLSGTVSIKGRFAAPDILLVRDVHKHASWLRDIPSYVGHMAVDGL